MIQILGLHKVGTEQPQQFELTYKDLDYKGKGYFQTTKYDTEPLLRTELQERGIARADINNLFARAFTRR